MNQYGTVVQQMNALLVVNILFYVITKRIKICNKGSFK